MAGAGGDPTIAGMAELPGRYAQMVNDVHRSQEVSLLLAARPQPNFHDPVESIVGCLTKWRDLFERLSTSEPEAVSVVSEIDRCIAAIRHDPSAMILRHER